MLTFKRVVLLAIAAFLITPVVRVDPAAAGQRRWGRDPVPQAGVCFYSDIEFRGDYFCVRPGENVDQLPRGLNDEISSFRIIGNIEVTVFRDVRFEGPSARFSNDVPDLRRDNWNDAISSLRVTNFQGSQDRGRDGRDVGRDVGRDEDRGGRFPVWGRQAPPNEGACFYRDVNYQGEYFCVRRGESFARLPAGFEDQVSSIRLIRATGVMVFVDRDFSGKAARVTGDAPDLRRGIWNDRLSSFRVY